jgi:hypothetical protein
VGGFFFGIVIGIFLGCCFGDGGGGGVGVVVVCWMTTFRGDETPISGACSCSVKKSTRSCFFLSFESKPRSLKPESLMSCFRSATFMDSNSVLLGIAFVLALLIDDVEEGGVASDMDRGNNEDDDEHLACCCRVV